MATVFKSSYPALGTITITLNALATAGARQSAFVDNNTDLNLDALVQLVIQLGAGTIGANPVVEVWAYADVDGTNYTDGATGADAAYTLLATPNLVFLGVVNALAQSTTYYSKPFSIASAFGSMPKKWGIICVNKTGIALGAASAAKYQGIQTQGV
jgi:hypothetical protein